VNNLERQRELVYAPLAASHPAAPVVWACMIFATLALPALIVADPLLGAVFFLVLFLAAAALLRIDAVILASFVLLFCFYRFEIQHLGNHKKYSDVFVISAIPVVVPYLFWWVRRGSGIDDRKGRNYINKLAAAIILLGAVSYAWTADAVHGLVLTYNMICNFMIIQLLSVAISDSASMRRVLVFLVVLGCTLGMYTIATKFYRDTETKYQVAHSVKFVVQSGGEGLGNSKKIRANGFAKSDVAGFAFNLFIFVTLAFVISGSTVMKRSFALAALFYLLMCLVLTGSKGALGGVLLGLPIAVFVNPVLRGRKINWMVGLVLLLALAFVVNYVVFDEGRIAKSMSGGGSTKVAVASFSTRLELWKIGLQEFLPTYGLGLGNGTSAGFAERKDLPHMHSFFFSVLFDLGFVGFTLYMMMIAKIGMRLNTMRQYGAGPFEQVLASCLCGALVAALFQGALISEYANLIFWFILGLITAVTSLPAAQTGKTGELQSGRAMLLEGGKA
jgi:hypothetical protein